MTSICKYYYVTHISNRYFKYTRSIESFQNDDLFEYLNMTTDKFIDFLQKIQNTQTLTKILYNRDDFQDMNKIIKMSDCLSPMIKIFCFGFSDWWVNQNLNISDPHTYFYITNAFYYSRIRYIVCTDYKTLGFFLNKNLEEYQTNIISWDVHNCYDNCFVNLNYNPINKILVSGDTWQYGYPDRYKLLNFNNVCQKIRANDMWSNETAYSTYLNQYICCFGTSHYPYSHTTEKQEYSGLILLKTYEILGSGALLLSPLTDKPILEKIGLIEDVNCMFIDMTNDVKIQDKIDFILNEKNRDFINNVRQHGQNHGKENLNSKKKYKMLKELIINSE